MNGPQHYQKAEQYLRACQALDGVAAAGHPEAQQQQLAARALAHAQLALVAAELVDKLGHSQVVNWRKAIEREAE